MKYNSYSQAVTGLYKVVDGLFLLFEGLFTVLFSLLSILWINKKAACKGLFAILCGIVFICFVVCFCWLFVSVIKAW